MSFSSLVPALFGRDWWDAYDYPARIMDQCFASPIVDEDLLSPRIYRGFLVRPRTQANVAGSGVSEVKNDETKFEVSDYRLSALLKNTVQIYREKFGIEVFCNFI